MILKDLLVFAIVSAYFAAVKIVAWLRPKLRPRLIGMTIRRLGFKWARRIWRREAWFTEAEES